MTAFFLDRHRPGLFRSQAWLDAWLASWGDHSEILPLTKINCSELSSTLYAYESKIKNIWPVKTAFPLGISTFVAPSIRSEYFNLELGSIPPESLVTDYLRLTRLNNCHQLYIPDVLYGSREWDAIYAASNNSGFECIVKEVNLTYGINVGDNNFEFYLEQLGSNTRLKLFNRRKNLTALGDIKIVNLWPNQDYFYDLLNFFHEKRWGKPCYKDRNLKFIGLLLDNLANEGHYIDLSLMTLNDRPISVVFDINYNGRIYNLQSGYIEGFAKNISLGTLHLGYQIEAAFASPFVNFYDLMAGNGKNTNYKVSLANSEAMFNSFLLVGSPLLKTLYKLKKLLG